MRTAPRPSRPSRPATACVSLVVEYDGEVFDSYNEADKPAEQLGFPELMRQAVQAVRDLPDGFVAAELCNGAGMAEYVATQRSCSGALMISGALPVRMLGVDAWPAQVPAQIHHTRDDPYRQQEQLDALLVEITTAVAPVRPARPVHLRLSRVWSQPYRGCRRQ